jgi:tRNA (cytosine34-C5)-methyltransferase
VVQLIKRTGGAMRLIDARHIIHSLRSDPGMKTWKVVSAKGEVATQPGEHQMHDACFPPSPAEAEDMHLELCMRFLPKHCGGGGFFIAVLEKVGEYEQAPLSDVPFVRMPMKASRSGDSSEATAPKTNVDEDQAPEAAVKIPPCFLPSFDEAKNFLRDFMKAPDFPCDHLYTRAPHGERTLKPSLGNTCSLVSNDVARMLDRHSKLIIVAAGLRVLAVETLTKSWRVANEAAGIVNAFVVSTERIMLGSPRDVAQLLGEQSEANGVAIDKIESTPLREAAGMVPVGCVIMRVETSNPLQRVLPIALMRARNRLSLLVDKDDVDDLKCRLNIGEPSAAAGAAAEE